MARIEKRGERSWRLEVSAGFDSEGKRIRYRKTITVEDDNLLKKEKKLREYLETELAKFRQEVEAGAYIKPEKMNFTQFVNEWKTRYAEKEFSPLTLTTYMYHVKNHILPAFGNKKMDDIKPFHIVKFISDLQRPETSKKGPLSSSTIIYIYNVLRNIFKTATDWKIISKNPMDGIKKPKKEKQEVSFYSMEEVKKLITALQEEPEVYRLFFLGALLGGFRRGELLALEWTDVDFEENVIHIRKSISLERAGKIFEKGTKNEEERIVDMPSWYMDELKKYRKKWREEKLVIMDRWEGGDREYIFHAGFGKPFYPSWITHWWADFLSRHGLRKIRLHDLRHTSATMLIEAGAPLKAIQERLGHKQYQTTADIYAHVTKKASKGLAETIDKITRPQSN